MLMCCCQCVYAKICLTMDRIVKYTTLQLKLSSLSKIKRTKIKKLNLLLSVTFSQS